MFELKFMISLLPQPRKIDKIAFMFGLNRYFSVKRSLVSKPVSISSYVKQMKDGATYAPKTVGYDRMNMYFLNRSLHQANEACNKLWSTLEVHHKIMSGDKICKKFKADFLSSSSVPTLHYANITAIISGLSLFGLVSIAERGRNLTFYNLVRTGDGMIMMKRNKYLTDVFGFAKSGWHAQVLQIYEGFIQKGIKLPKVSLMESKKLQRKRLELQYDILGKTSMKGISGIDLYFDFLPFVNQSLEAVVENIHQVVKPIPSGVGSRFQELKSRISDVIEMYEQMRS